MANVKISQLPTASAVTSDDFLPIVDSGSTTTQQASFQQVLDYVTGSTFNELTVGSLSASFLYVSASVIQKSGSTKFGDTSDDTHQFTGSVYVSQNIEATQITGSIVSASNFYGDGTGITGVTAEWDGTHSGNAEISGALSITGSVYVSQNIEAIQITGSVVSASNFYGDGSGITGVTGEWDGTHTGNAEITGTLSVENGNINITQNAYFLQGTATGGSNVSLIGVSSGDEIEIGNQGYTNRVVDDLVVSGTLIGSVALSGAVGSEIQASSYSLSADDRGKTLIFSSSATQGITCSSGLDVGFNSTFVQYGSGQLELSAASGVTILNRQSHTKTAGTYAAASVVIISSDVYLFSGDTSA